MNPRDLPASLLDRVEKAHILRYAQTKGWKQQHLLPGRFIILSHPSDELRQLLVPDNPAFDDYRQCVAQVVASLAEVERRQPVDVLSAILFPPSDVVRFRALGEDMQRGDLSFAQAAHMIQGIRKSVLAAACSVVKPQPFHQRLDNSKAERLVDACRLRQTEVGSFTFVLACPMDAEEERPKPSNDLPFARKSTSLFMRSIQWVGSKVDGGATDRDVETAHESAALSSNLCEALLDMQPEQENAALNIAVDWAWSLPPTPELAHITPVTLRKEHFSFLSDVAQNLRSRRAQEKPEYYVGHVQELKGTPGANEAMQGEVVLRLFDDDSRLRVRADLPPELWAHAHYALGKNHLVGALGILRPYLKGYRLDPILDLRPLDPPEHAR